MNDQKVKYLTIGVFTLAIINIALLTFLFLGKPSIDDRPRQMRNQFPNRGAQFLEKSLNLDASQKKDFRNAAMKHREKRDSLDREILIAKKQVIEQIIDNKSNPAKVDSLINIITNLHRENEQELYNHFEELKTICTKKQLKKLKEILTRSNTFEKGKR